MHCPTNKDIIVQCNIKLVKKNEHERVVISSIETNSIHISVDCNDAI